MRTILSLTIVALFGSTTALAQGISYRSLEMWATVQEGPAQIELHWPCDSLATTFRLYKRTLDSYEQFGTEIATLDASACSYVDTDVEVGTVYDYMLLRYGGTTARGVISSGIKVDESSFRGNILVVHDTTLQQDYASEFATFLMDLEGDGWKPILIEVDRNDDVEFVHSLIKDEYLLDPSNTRSVILFGHVPVPYSGTISPDGHGDHNGAWPADVYYADMTGAWTDVTANSTIAADPRNHNVPGDGKFDQNSPPDGSGSHEVPYGMAELEVGRVDFSDLPTFWFTEGQLYHNYLVKDHDYRHGNLVLPDRALMHDNLGVLTVDGQADSGWRSFSTIVGKDSVVVAWYETVFDNPYKWSFGIGYGTYSSANAVINSSTYATNWAQTIFTFLWGSYFGDWDTQNNLMRSALGSGSILTSAWSGRPKWYLQSMAMGRTIGFNAKVAQNRAANSLIYGGEEVGERSVHIALLGDPSLTSEIVAPPSDLMSTTGSNAVFLNWQPSPDTVLGYDVYRKGGSSSEFERINSSLVTDQSYVDGGISNTGEYQYMVRAVKLEVSRTGTYYNRSQGVFDTTQVFVAIDELDNQVMVSVFPNPASLKLNVQVSARKPLGLSCLDATGRVLTSGIWEPEVDVSAFSPGVYFLRIDFEDGSSSTSMFEVQR